MSDLLPSEIARFEEVCRFGRERLEPIASTVARAFADDPIWQWIIGVDRTLELDEAMPLARVLVADTSPIDETHGLRHHDAVALWRAPIGHKTESMQSDKQERSDPHYQALAAQIGDRMAQVGELSAALTAARPVEPHWYLAILATAPERQGQGLGAHVVGAMLDRCDQIGVPTYLESSNPRNHAFYARLGYQPVHEVTAAGCPPATGFVRPAR